MSERHCRDDESCIAVLQNQEATAGNARQPLIRPIIKLNDTDILSIRLNFKV